MDKSLSVNVIKLFYASPILQANKLERLSLSIPSQSSLTFLSRPRAYLGGTPLRGIKTHSIMGLIVTLSIKCGYAECYIF
jgi:hypothetical protein